MALTGTRCPSLQVAGRAGRFGSQFPDGIVTALDPADLALLAHELEQPSEELATAFLFPSLSQLELLHGQYPQVGGAGAVDCVCKPFSSWNMARASGA